MPSLKRTDDGTYTFGDKKNDKRWTAFVIYPYDPQALALDIDGLREVLRAGQGSMEEIDVNAPSYNIAMAVASAALEADYDDGGKIVELQERIGLYF